MTEHPRVRVVGRNGTEEALVDQPPRGILVTGAGRGIGLATAELFLDRGWRVGLADVDREAVSRAAAGRERALALQLDVRDAAQWRTALDAFADGGGVDVVVNNAGVLSSGPFVGTAPESHRRMVDVNVLGTVNGALAAHQHLRRSRGVLLNLCSASALYGHPTLATYAATKAAVKALTEALDLEWAADGVRVRSLVPLFVDTDMVTRYGRQVASTRRLGVRLQPRDVAEAAWRVVHEGPSRLRSPHRPIGLQTHVLAAATAVSPSWAARLVTRALTR